MNTYTWKLVGLAAAVMGFIFTVQAEPAGDAGKKEGKKGQRPSREQMLEKFDTDGNGELDEAERAAMKEAMQKQHGERQGDRPSKEEILQKFDADGDGELNEEERKAVRESMGERGGRKGRGNRQEMTKKFDADGDGQLSEDERAAMRAEFESRKDKKGAE